MGKLQIRGGSGEVPQLDPREPYFDGEKLFIGNLEGNGNKEIGGSAGDANVQLIEWVLFEPKPTITCHVKTGDFVEGRKHLVSYSIVNEEVVADIKVLNWVEPILEKYNRQSPFGPVIEHWGWVLFYSYPSLIFHDLDENNNIGSLNLDGVVEFIAKDLDENLLYLAGNFTGRICRFDPDNFEVDTSFTATFANDIAGLFIQPNGLPVIVESNTYMLHAYNQLTNEFESMGRYIGPHSHLYFSDPYVFVLGKGGLAKKLWADWDAPVEGFVQEVWPPQNSWYMDLQIDGNGKLYVGCSAPIATYGALLRLNSDGSLDTTFAPPQFTMTRKIILDSGFIYAKVNDGVDKIVRLLSSGAVDSTFTPISTESTSSFAVINSSETYVVVCNYGNGTIAYDSNGVRIDVEKSFIGELMSRISALEPNS